MTQIDTVCQARSHFRQFSALAALLSRYGENSKCTAEPELQSGGMDRSGIVFGVILACFCGVISAQKQPFDVSAVMRLARLSAPQISPNGRLVAFSAQTIDIENNKKRKQIYVVPLEGGEPRKIADSA